MIPYKSKLSKYKDIEKRNKAFESLSATEKRKEIALDGLNLVLNRKISASMGEYWNGTLHKKVRSLTDSKRLQEVLLNELAPSCEVCQRGLMMISQIRLSNEISPREDLIACGSSDIIKGFSLTAFKQMENEYEACEYNHPYKWNTGEKLANICCNVIANGNFKATDKTDYLKLWNLKIKEQ